MRKKNLEHEFDYDTLKAGHAGHDVLRDTARRTFEPEMRGLDMHVPESLSARDRQRMRPYKKGGHVKTKDGRVCKDFGGDFWTGFKMPFQAIGKIFGFKDGGHVYGLNHGQTDLHLPRRSKTRVMHQPLMEKVEHKKSGGPIVHRKCKIKENPLTPEFMHALEAHMHKMHGKKEHGRRVRREIGGSMSLNDPSMQLAYNPMKDPNSDMGYGSPAAQVPTIMAKRGGKVAKRAGGGTIYEREMLGERPSKRAPHFNYEAEMRGEHPVSRAPVRRSSKAGRLDESMGTTFKKGGRAHREMGGAMDMHKPGMPFKKGGRVRRGLGGDIGKALFSAVPGLLSNLGQAGGQALGTYAQNKGGMLGELGRNVAPSLAQAAGNFGANAAQQFGQTKGWFKKGGRVHRADGGMGRYSSGGMGRYAKGGEETRAHKGAGGMGRYSSGGMGRYAKGGMHAQYEHGGEPMHELQMSKRGGRVHKGMGGAFLGNLLGTLGPALGGFLPFEKGGRVKHQAHHEGHRAKKSTGGMGRYAIGGTGKIRHEVATSKGQQKMRPARRVPRGGGC